MTRARTRLAERVVDRTVDDLLAVATPEVVVAPEVVNPYASLITANPYAELATADPYAALATGDPYEALAPTPDPYEACEQGPSPYLSSPYLRPAKRKLIRTVVLLPPPKPPKEGGGLLWMPAVEYEGMYEWSWDEFSHWLPGHVIDFSEAAESAASLWELDPELSPLMNAPLIKHLSEAMDTRPDDFRYAMHSPLWSDLMGLAKRKRAWLIDNQDMVIEYLVRNPNRTRRRISTLAGMPESAVTAATVAAAMGRSTDRELGGATLDLLTWEDTGWGEEIGGGTDLEKQMDELCEEIEQEEYVSLSPRDQFILHVGDLHPGTLESEGWYFLHSKYVVTGVEYYHDKSNRIPYGWRLCHLSPEGEVAMPSFGSPPVQMEVPFVSLDTTIEMF